MINESPDFSGRWARQDEGDDDERLTKRVDSDTF